VHLRIANRYAHQDFIGLVCWFCFVQAFVDTCKRLGQNLDVPSDAVTTKARDVVGIFQCVQSLMRPLKPDQTRESLASECKAKLSADGFSLPPPLARELNRAIEGKVGGTSTVCGDVAEQLAPALTVD
jgi:hypothetical protein